MGTALCLSHPEVTPYPEAPERPAGPRQAPESNREPEEEGVND